MGGAQQHLGESALLNKRRAGISGRENHPSEWVDEGDNMAP